MKWLLPEPNDPCRNAACDRPELTAVATRPRAASNARAIAGVTT
jgi:hypothetical protein